MEDEKGLATLRHDLVIADALNRVQKENPELARRLSDELDAYRGRNKK